LREGSFVFPKLGNKENVSANKVRDFALEGKVKNCIKEKELKGKLERGGGGLLERRFPSETITFFLVSNGGKNMNEREWDPSERGLCIRRAEKQSPLFKKTDSQSRRLLAALRVIQSRPRIVGGLYIIKVD